MPFDVASLTVTGSPVPLLNGILVQSSGAANYSLSDNGRLAYMSDSAPPTRSLVWVDRAGQETPIPAPARGYVFPRVSPDGTRVALDIRDGVRTQQQGIWVWTEPNGPLTRLTFGASRAAYGNWTPSGANVIFSSNRDGDRMGLHSKAADGAGMAKQVYRSVNSQFPDAVTPDGRFLMIKDREGPDDVAVPTITVVLNWHQELLERVPVP